MLLKYINFVGLCIVVNAQTSGKNYGICESPSKMLGYCVEIEYCPKIKELNEMRGLIFEDELIARKELIASSQCGKTNDARYLFCCEDSIFGNPNVPKVSNLPTRLLDNLLPTEGECIVSIKEKIVGGTETRIDEFPWTAVLLYSYRSDNSDASAICSGSLISNRYVVTAAHCGESKDLTESNIYLSGVRLGEWNKNEEKDCQTNICADPHQDITVEKIIIHENYNEAIEAKHNDIALLKLSRTVKFSKFIKPICLPLTPELKNRKLDGIALDVTGWGKTENGTNSPIKLKASIKGVPLQTCNMIFKTNPPLVETQMCAGGEKGIDSCKGDSGGPLIGTYIPESGLPYYYLVGVVSVGINNCLKGLPGVYTRVTSFVPWILREIEN